MQIKDMFRKKIDREIQGVIIVGQGEETNVAQELEEYVVTRELQRHFADFFAAYKKGIQGTTPKMNCTPFVRQYGILSNKWGVFLCQKEYQTNDIRRNSKNW